MGNSLHLTLYKIDVSIGLQRQCRNVHDSDQDLRLEGVWTGLLVKNGAGTRLKSDLRSAANLMKFQYFTCYPSNVCGSA